MRGHVYDPDDDETEALVAQCCDADYGSMVHRTTRTDAPISVPEAVNGGRGWGTETSPARDQAGGGRYAGNRGGVVIVKLNVHGGLIHNIASRSITAKCIVVVKSRYANEFREGAQDQLLIRREISGQAFANWQS